MDLSPEKIFLVGIIALMVLGPGRLPQAARTAGRALAEARRLSNSMHEEVSKALAEPRQVVAQVVEDSGLGGPPKPPATSSTPPTTPSTPPTTSSTPPTTS